MAFGLEQGAYVRMLSAVFAAMFLIRVAFGVTLVTFGNYLIGESDLIYSLIVSSSPLLELLTVVFAGVLIDRYGRKGVLLTGLGLGAISLYGLALTENPILLFFVNALHGVAAALILVTTLAIIATHAAPEHRGREMGFFNLANIFGWIAGFALGAVLLDVFAQRLEYTFVIAGALATAGLLYANRMIHLPAEKPSDYADHHRPSLSELYKAASNPRIVLLILPWLIVFMLVGPFITFFPRVAGGSLQISGASTALGVLAVGALLLASQLVWGRLADRRGREGIMLVGAVGFALLMGIIVYGFFETSPETVVTPVASFEVGEPEASTLSTMAAVAAVEGGPDSPVVASVEPRSGPPGTEVLVRGEALDLVTRVTFSGVAASFETFDGGTLLRTSVPEGAATGPMQLVSPTPARAIFENVMSHWILLTLFLFTALAYAPAGLAAIADEAKGGAEGTTMSAYSLTLSLGFIVGPPVVGAISDAWGGSGMVIYFAALAAGLLALVFTRYVQTRGAAAESPARPGGGGG